MYELMVVGKATGDADSLFKKIEKVVKDAGASSFLSEKLGKKPLAYPIQKQTEAEYFLFTFEVAGEAVKSISESLRLEQEAVLRYLIVVQKAKGKEKKPRKVLEDGGEVEKPVKIKASEKEEVKKPSSKSKKEPGKTTKGK